MWGVNTGECVDGYCQLKQWCPPENDTITQTHLVPSLMNFTIFLKVAARFKKFDIYLENTKDILGDGGLVDGYNLFFISDIFEECGVEIDSIQETGVSVIGAIEYRCNFDSSADCFPYPKFHWRVRENSENSVSTGFNFREVYYQTNYSTFTGGRLLVKYFGIRMEFNIVGSGGKWDISSFSSTLGSGIALTAISSVIAEILLRYFTPTKKFYKKRRLEVVTIEQETEWRSSRAKTVELTDMSNLKYPRQSSGSISVNSAVEQDSKNKSNRIVERQGGWSVEL